MSVKFLGAVQELGKLMQGVGANVARHDELLEVQARTINNLAERVEELEDDWASGVMARAVATPGPSYGGTSRANSP